MSNDSKKTALRYASTSAEAFRDNADLVASLGATEWQNATGCAKWDMRALEGHIVGEAVWFPHLVREVVDGEPPLPGEVWGELAQLPGDELASRIRGAADELVHNVENASPDDLQKPADLGWMTIPLWQGLFVAVMEGVYHNWDARASRDPRAAIPTAWALVLAERMPVMAGFLARQEELHDAKGRYLLEVGDGVGPVNLKVDGQVVVEGGSVSSPDATLNLSADQYVRLIVGRFPLGPAIDRGEASLSGDRRRAESLNHVFKGIANE
jgi:uncharacterized protein (TIGR03083 family)